MVRKITTLPHTPSSCQRASVERVAAHLRGSACQVITNDRLADLNIHYLLEVADPLYRSLSPRVTRVGGKPVNNSDHFGITRQQVRRGRNLGLVVAGFELMGQRNNARHARCVVPRVIARQPCGSRFFRCQYLIGNFVHPTAGPSPRPHQSSCANKSPRSPVDETLDLQRPYQKYMRRLRGYNNRLEGCLAQQPRTLGLFCG